MGNPSVSSTDLAEQLLRAGKYRRALLLFEELLAAEPQNGEARLGVAECGLALRETGRPLELLSELKSSYTPEQRARWAILRTEALMRSGDIDQARSFVEEWLPSFDTTWRAKLFLRLAYVCLLLKRRDPAKAYVAQAHALALSWSTGEGEDRSRWTPRNQAALANTALLVERGDIAISAARSLFRTRYAPAAPAVLLAGLWVRAHPLFVKLPLVFGLLLLAAVPGWTAFVLLGLLAVLLLNLGLALVYGFWGSVLTLLQLAVIVYGTVGMVAGLNALPDDWANALGCLVLLLMVVGLVYRLRRWRLTPEQRQKMIDGQQAAQAMPALRLAGPADKELGPPNHVKARRGRRLIIGLMLASIAAPAVCCWLANRPIDTERGLQTLWEIQSRMQAARQEAFPGVVWSRVAYSTFDREGETLRVALMVLDYEESLTSDGIAQFAAQLRSTGDYPLEDVRVTLWLLDNQGSTVEGVDLRLPGPILNPGQEVRLAGSFEPAATAPRILTETLRLKGPFDVAFNVFAEGVQTSPGFLSRLAGALPWTEYSAVWTVPAHPWTAHHFEILVGNVIGE